MSGSSSAKKLFHDTFSELYKKYLDHVDIGSWGVDSRTIRSWLKLDGPVPKEASFEGFVKEALARNSSFPADVLLSAFHKARNEQLHNDSYEHKQPINNNYVIYQGARGYEIEFEAWCETAVNITILQTWITYPTVFPRSVIERLKNPEDNINMRVLLLHPSSELIKYRLKATDRHEDDFNYALRNLEADIRNHKLYESGSKFQLRFYNTLPTFAAYIADSHLMIAQFWYKQKTAQGPHLDISGENDFAKAIRVSVEKLWSDSGNDVDLTAFQSADFIDKHR